MTLSKSNILVCTFLVLPGAALSQDVSGAATLGYAHSSVSNGGGDLNAYTVDGAGDITFQNGFAVGLTGSVIHADPDGGGGDIDLTDLGSDLTYTTYSGAMFGGYLDYTDLSGNGLLTGSADATSYGLTGGYAGQMLQIKANVGWTDASGAGLGVVSDWMDYGVNVSYTPTERTRIAGHWQLSDVDTNFGGTDLSSVGVGASHDFGAGFVGFGGISRVDFDAANVDATSYGVGVGYDLSQISSVPAQVSLELARTNLDAGAFGDTDVDTVRLGVTIPLGGPSNQTPLNSLSESIMAPRHNALSTLFDNIF
ncbi:porin [Roseovarius sp. S4756]|uniref:porin n=1 Tax=Roseovarius maritimus TaxID=3342637 RepID=UPI00372770B4